jgi:hypothetical protein
LALLAPWLWIGAKRGVVRSPAHLSGAGDLRPEETRVAAAKLYETPDAVMRRALFAPASAVQDDPD